MANTCIFKDKTASSSEMERLFRDPLSTPEIKAPVLNGNIGGRTGTTSLMTRWKTWGVNAETRMGISVLGVLLAATVSSGGIIVKLTPVVSLAE